MWIRIFITVQTWPCQDIIRICAGLALSIRTLGRQASGITMNQKFLLQAQLLSKVAFPTDCSDSLLGHDFTVMTWGTAPCIVTFLLGSPLRGIWKSILRVLELLRYIQASSTPLYQCPKEVKVLRTSLRVLWCVNAPLVAIPGFSFTPLIILSLKSPSGPQSIQPCGAAQTAPAPLCRHADTISIPTWRLSFSFSATGATLMCFTLGI